MGTKRVAKTTKPRRPARSRKPERPISGIEALASVVALTKDGAFERPRNRLTHALPVDTIFECRKVLDWLGARADTAESTILYTVTDALVQAELTVTRLWNAAGNATNELVKS